MNVKRDRGTDGPGSAGKRPRVAGSTEKAEKTGKGLRHFSMKVCKKVKEKGVTSYNEVADELVLEQQVRTFSIATSPSSLRNVPRY